MDFDEVVRTRRSVRKFLAREVPDATVQALIECAIRAPSSMNGQPWLFIAIRDAEVKRRLAAIKNRYCPVEKKDFSADFLMSAPVILVTCVDRSKAFQRGLENGVLATGHLLLAAANHGLTGVYLSAYESPVPSQGSLLSREISELLCLPEGLDPVTIVPIGFPAEMPPAKTLVDARQVTFYDAFRQNR